MAYRWSYPRVEPNPFHILEVTPVKLKKDLSFEVQPVAIVDQEMKQLRSEVISMVKVLWRSDSVEKMTWETIASMRFWETKPLSLSFRNLACGNFGDKISVRRVQV